MKSRDQIRSETPRVQVPRSANYEYGKRIKEWDAALPNTSQLTREDFISSVEPRNDRLLVQLLAEPQAGAIVLTDARPLIGGCRKAKVLKVGPGKWIEGEWWYMLQRVFYSAPNWDREPEYAWEWIPGFRRPVNVTPGQVVLIGNWVDLEVEDVALCQEQDVRAIVGNSLVNYVPAIQRQAEIDKRWPS